MAPARGPAQARGSRRYRRSSRPAERLVNWVDLREGPFTATEAPPRSPRPFPVNPGRHHRGVAFRDERAVAKPGLGARQAGDARQFAAEGHAGAVEKTARDLGEGRGPADAPRQRLGEAAHAQGVDVGEGRLVVDGTRDDEHGGLELVESPREGGAVAYARIGLEVGGAHLPFTAEDAQQPSGRSAEARRLSGTAQAPDGVEIRDHARRDEGGFPAGQLAVVDTAAVDQLVFQHPGERRFGVLLDIAGQDGVAPAADRDVRATAPDGASRSGRR